MNEPFDEVDDLGEDVSPPTCDECAEELEQVSARTGQCPCCGRKYRINPEAF